MGHAYLSGDQPRTRYNEDGHVLRQGDVYLFDIVGETIQYPAERRGIKIGHGRMKHTSSHG